MEEYQRIAVLPENEHQEQIDTLDGFSSPESFWCFNPMPYQNSEEQNIEMHMYVIGQDLGIARRRFENEQLPLKEMDDSDYRLLIQNLNIKQKQFYYNILNHFKTSDLPMYTFLTGGAGVGKSVLLKSLYQALLKFYNRRVGENPHNIHVLLCAPTGKAAHLIGGNTIHSIFGIPVGRGFDFKPLDNHQLDAMRCKFFHVKVIFIDEISMVGRKMFNFINLRLQELKGSCKVFGGVSIIAFGDLFQLKPVMDSWIFSQSISSLESLGTNLWQDNFTIFELDEIMRQKDDLSFAQLLNKLRKGDQNPEDIKILQSQLLDLQLNNAISVNFDNFPHLFTTRSESDNHNFRVLSNLPQSNKIIVPAIDCISGEISSSLKDKIISKIPDDAGKTMGLQKSLHLGIGPPFEICLNVCVEDGLTNGTSCVIKMFDYRIKDSQRCSIVWVELENTSSGTMWRQMYSHLYKTDIPRNWTPILEVTRSFSVHNFKSYSVTRRQFPLRMSAGKTIHKAQGCTMNNVVLHFGSRKNDHMHYVGLSRVRNLANINIIELNENKISISNDVKEEMATTISLEELLTSKGQVPYNKSLKVKVAAAGTVVKHMNEKEESREVLNAAIVDHSRAIKCAIYDASKFQRFKDGQFLILRNVIKKTDSLVITKQTKVFPCGPFDVLEEIERKGREIIHPPTAPVLKVKDALSSPPKVRVTVRGKVVQEEATREVLVKDKATKLKNITLQNVTSKCRVALWRDISEEITRPGDYKEISVVVTNVYQNEVSLSTTSLTKIKKLDSPTESQRYECMAVCCDTEGITFLLCNDTILTIPCKIVKEALPEVLDEDIEIHLMTLCDPKLSFQCTYNGSKVSSIEFL